MNNKALDLKGYALIVCDVAIIGLSLIYAVCGTSFAVTYYVSPSGDNINSGTNEAPWATPDYGAGKLQPGDILIIKSGNYVLQGESIEPNSGIDGSWVTIRGEPGTQLIGSGELSVIIDINKSNYVRIENLEITSDGGGHPEQKGISIWGPSEHIILNNLSIHHLNGEGLKMREVNDLKLINSQILYCGYSAIDADKGERGWRNVLIDHCNLSYSGHYYQGTPGPSPYARPDGLGSEYSEGPLEIANTTAVYNRGDGLDSKVANTYIHHCVVAHNTGEGGDSTGIKLWRGDSRVENCLVYNTADAGLVINVPDEADSGAKFNIINSAFIESSRTYPVYVQYGLSNPIDLVMRNCIIYDSGSSTHIGRDVDFTADHCIFYRADDEPPLEINKDGSFVYISSSEIEGGHIGPGNIARNPRFVSQGSPSIQGYELREDSPALDAGTCVNAPIDDLLHVKRPQGPNCDIGPLEKRRTSIPDCPECPSCPECPLDVNVVGIWQLKLTDRAIIDLDISQLGGIIFGRGNISSEDYKQSVTASGSIKGKWLEMDIVPVSGTEMYAINLDLSNQPTISGIFNIFNISAGSQSGTVSASRVVTVEHQVVNESEQLFEDTKVLNAEHNDLGDIDNTSPTI